VIRLWVACFTGYLAIGATIQVLPSYGTTHLGLSVWWVGTLITIGSLASMVARPLAGRRADRRGAREVAVLGGVMASIGGVAHALAGGPLSLLLGRLLLGAGEGTLFTGAIAWVLAANHGRAPGRLVGRFGLSMWSGLVAGPIVAVLLRSALGLDAVWVAIATTPLLGAVLAASTPKLQSVGAGRHGDLIPRGARRPGLAFGLASIGYGTINAFLILDLANRHFGGRSLALALFGAAFLLTRFLGTSVVDRVDPRLTAAGFALIETTGLLTVALASSTAVALSGVILVGVGVSLLYPAFGAITVQATGPDQHGAAVGSMTAAWDLGLAAAGPLGALALSGAGYSGPFVLAGITAVASAAITAPRSLRVRRAQIAGEQ